MKKFRLFFEKWKWYFVNALIIFLTALIILPIIYSVKRPVKNDPEPAVQSPPVETIEIKADPYIFNDKNLEESLLKNGIDLDADDIITLDELEMFYMDTLDLSDSGIKDLSGLARCEKIKSLNLSGNNLSDINELVRINGLKAVDLTDNGADFLSDDVMDTVNQLRSDDVDVLIDEIVIETVPEPVDISFNWSDLTMQSDAVAFSKENWESAPGAVLINKNAKPDLASSAILAKVKNIPIFPMDKDDNQAVLDEIIRLADGKTFDLYIIGGEYVIPTKSLYYLNDEDNIIQQRLFGKDMAHTAVAIIDALSDNLDMSKAYVTNGAIKEDCVTAANLSAKNKIPVLLVDYAGAEDITLDALTRYGINEVIIIGEEVTGKSYNAIKKIIGEENIS